MLAHAGRPFWRCVPFSRACILFLVDILLVGACSKCCGYCCTIDLLCSCIIQELHGCFEAVAKPGFNLNPRAFGGTRSFSPFPCQVRTRRWLDAPPLRPSEYQSLLRFRHNGPDPSRPFYELGILRVSSYFLYALVTLSRRVENAHVDLV